MYWNVVIWEVFVNTVEALLYLYLLLRQLEHDPEKRPYIFGGIILKILWITFLNFNAVGSTPTLILCLFFDLIYCTLLFKGSYGRRLLWGCCPVVIALVANNFTFWVADKFTEYHLQDLVVSGKIRMLMTLVYLLTCAMLVIVFSHWRKKDLFLSVRFRIMLLLLICTGIIASDQLLGIIIRADHMENNSDFIGQLELIGLTILLILFGFVIFIEYLGIVTEQNEKLRNWKHDYKTHLQVILNLAKEGNNRELEDFVQGLETTLVHTTHLISTDNQTLDALLSAKILEFQQYSIKFSYEVYLIKVLPLDDILFTSLIGNLLDNAFEACRCMDGNLDKYINFSIKPFHEMIYISVENSTSNRYHYHADGTLKTTKKINGHGIGLKRVQGIVSGVQGFCNIYPESDKFTVIIMLPLPESTKGTTHGD